MLLLNSHPRDQRIEFDEPTHTYFIDGSSKNVVSSTTFIHHFFQPFDSEKVIHKMMANTKKFNEGIYKGMSAEEIKNKWDRDGKEASKLGTEMHRSIETFYKYGIQPNDPPREFQFFKEFQQKVVEEQGWIPYRSEWSIFIEELKLAGQLDMLYQQKKKESTCASYILCDWKRSKSIVQENSYQCGKKPLNHLQDCNYNHYQLQLNLYKYILEKYYDLTISEMYLVILHPNQDTYLQIPVREMQKEIESLIKCREEELK